jgi:hypothetical protein
MGEQPVAELQFADFISCPFDAIMNVGAKTLALRARATRGHPGAVRRRPDGPFTRPARGWFLGAKPSSSAGVGRRLRAPARGDRRRHPIVFFETRACTGA